MVRPDIGTAEIPRNRMIAQIPSVRRLLDRVVRVWFGVMFLSGLAPLVLAGAEREPGPAHRIPLADQVFTWAVTYARLPVASLSANLAGLLLLDPDHLQAGDVAVLQRGKRRVFAYLSVGEMEGYRAYAKRGGIRDLVLGENPDWPDNFRIRFWEPRWIDTLGLYLEQILAKGFDGLVFDVVDAWEAFPEEEKLQRRSQMADLIVGLAERARRIHPDVGILFLNSHVLFEDARVAQLCDGLLQEGLYAGWLPPSAKDDVWRKEKETALKALRARGKFVGLLEYTRDPLQMKMLKKRSVDQGFAVYFGEKSLDTLFPIP